MEFTMTLKRIIILAAVLVSANVVADWGLPGQTCSGSDGQNCDVLLPDDNLVSSTFTVANCPQLLDVVVGVEIQHTWISDLEIFVKSPAATILRIVTGSDCSEEDMRAVLDDDAPTAVDDECEEVLDGPTINGIYFPSQTLADFNGESGNGTWTLTIEDNADDDTGQLIEWSLDLVCHEQEIISCDGFESCPTL
jgi:subtilisin-like proprotein convertase family protein